jgi:hypothetical protein
MPVVAAGIGASLCLRRRAEPSMCMLAPLHNVQHLPQEMTGYG